MTLGCLVLAMTACTAVLAWLEPYGGRSTGLTGLAFPRQQATDALDAGGDTASLQRGIIDIVSSGGGESAARPVLAATRRGDVDFVVFEDGAIRAGERWTRRSHGKTPESPISVYVVGVANQNDVPVTQWVGLRALLVRLGARIENTGGRTSIRIDSSVGAESARYASLLRQLLAFDGLTAPDDRDVRANTMTGSSGPGSAR